MPGKCRRLVQPGDDETVAGQQVEVPPEWAMVVVMATERRDPSAFVFEVTGDFAVALSGTGLLDRVLVEEARMKDRKDEYPVAGQ